jgi:hypothetical protein
MSETFGLLRSTCGYSAYGISMETVAVVMIETAVVTVKTVAMTEMVAVVMAEMVMVVIITTAVEGTAKTAVMTVMVAVVYQRGCWFINLSSVSEVRIM